MSRASWFLGAGLICVLAAAPWALAGDAAYYQQPDIHGNSIVFCAERDLWSVPSGGGTATRLTTHEGNEYFPHFSPDGQWIAFTSNRAGVAAVYVVSVDGGDPTRLSWYPAGAFASEQPCRLASLPVSI